MADKQKRWFDIFRPVNGQSKCTKVSIYDGIGMGTETATDFINALNAITTPEIELNIASDGGEVLAGFEIYNAIKKHPSTVTTHIDGMALSIASVIAVAGDKVTISKNGFIMMHNAWGKSAGDPSDLRKQADILDKLSTAIAEAYSAKTGKSVDEFRKAMEEETWLNASEAKSWGLVDAIDGEGDEQSMAASMLRAVAKYQKAPLSMRQFAARVMQEKNEPIQRKEKQMDKIVCKDGKWFLNEVEVDVSDVMASAAPSDQSKPDEKALAKAREEGMAAGKAEEAKYRTMFNTVVASANLDKASAEEFEKSFYGRAEADLKFLASHAIGQRAKAVGEGTPGNGEGQQKTEDEKADADLVAKAEKRFAENLDVRRMFGLASNVGSEDQAYVNALKRYVARERQWVKDQKTNGNNVASAQ